MPSHASSPQRATRPKKKRNDELRYDTKLHVLKKLKSGLTLGQVTQETGIPYYTVARIQRQAGNILSHGENMSMKVTGKKYREKNQLLTKTEALMITWIEDMRSKGFALSGDIIKTKAKTLYADVLALQAVQEDGVNRPFFASNGWFQGFKKRFNLKHVSFMGESASADDAAARNYVSEFETLVTEGGYDPRQVFNVDETGFYWKKMPKNTFITEAEMNAPGYKAHKQRLTVLIGGNAYGDCKLKPMVINQSQNPRALKEIRKEDLPVTWYSSRKAWMTQALFRDWFMHHFVPFVAQYNREQNLDNKAILLLDNAASHPRDLTDAAPHIRVVFLPPNTTSLLQPMDQGVISILKSNYLKITMNDIIQTEHDVQDVTVFWKNFTIKGAIDNISRAWSQVTENAMKGVWKKLWPNCAATASTDVETSLDDEMDLHQKELLQMAHLGGYNEVSMEDIQEVVETHNEVLTNEELLVNYVHNSEDFSLNSEQNIEVIPDYTLTEETSEVLTIDIAASDSEAPSTSTAHQHDAQQMSPAAQPTSLRYARLQKAAHRFKILGEELLEDDANSRELFRNMIDNSMILFRKFAPC